MVKIKIYMGNGNILTIVNPTYVFVEIIREIFKAKIYVTICRDKTSAYAINTDNILFIEEVKE